VARAALWSLAYIGSALSNGPRSGLRDIAHLLRDPALRIAIEMLSSCPMKVLASFALQQDFCLLPILQRRDAPWLRGPTS